MKPEDKKEIEDFAASMLGTNQSVSVFTGDLREKMKVNTQDLISTIGEYNQLSDEEKAYDFSRDFKEDNFDFWILIKKSS